MEGVENQRFSCGSLDLVNLAKRLPAVFGCGYIGYSVGCSTAQCDFPATGVSASRVLFSVSASHLWADLVLVLRYLVFVLLSLVFVLHPVLCFTLPGLCFTPWSLFYSPPSVFYSLAFALLLGLCFTLPVLCFTLPGLCFTPWSLLYSPWSLLYSLVFVLLHFSMLLPWSRL